MLIDSRGRRVLRRLLSIGTEGLYWPWLQKEDGTILARLTRKNANKFILGCIIDYQIPANKAWENAARLAETELRDPANLWETITRLSERSWMARRNKYSWLHRFPAAHRRVWRIGREIRDGYGGDSRLIWRGRSPEEVKARLLDMGLGPQLTRMAVGALIDTGHLKGTGDVKADMNVCRVLGRAVQGRPFTPAEATRVTRTMYRKNPWRLDAALFQLGRTVCGTRPQCRRCSLAADCAYYRRHTTRRDGI
jgi:hypothetical protein